MVLYLGDTDISQEQEAIAFSMQVDFSGEDVIVKDTPDYPPSTTAVVWDNWSTRDNGTLKYPPEYGQEESI